MTEEGTLELRINRFSEFVASNPGKQLFSAPTYIHGLVWRIGVKRTKEPNERQVFLEYTGGDDVPNWSCRTSVALRFVSQKDGVDDEIDEMDHNLSEGNREWTAINCEALLNPDNPFIKDNTLILQVHVKAEVPQNVRIAMLSKFASSISDPPDGVLIVGTNRIPIHKTYLSFYSESFKTMFQSEFKESRENEIVIEEVEYEEMIELLAVIYPLVAPITALNLKTILKLADQFIMPAVTERCKKELILNNFASSISDPPDGVLIVGTNRIPIHKMYLSFYSEFFKTMFRSEFKEGREDEILIEDVEHEEMIELLAVIYPSNAPITAGNLKYILKLADRFIMPAVLERCKKELRISTINGAQKLLLAQMYNFEDLQMEFAQRYRSSEDVMNLGFKPEYSQLDHKTLVLVFNSIAY